MTQLQIEQRTDEWYAARLGRITTSRFNDILAEPRSKSDKLAGKLSTSAETYMLELLAERLTGIPHSIPVNAAMAWGIEWEPFARRVYEEVNERTVDQTGFIIHRTIDGVGCSPDGLIGDIGGLEIKCPYNSHEHLRFLTTNVVPKQYVAQVQGAMWVADREWWDFVSYDPRQPEIGNALASIRVDRNDDFIQSLERACHRILDRIEEELNKAVSDDETASRQHTISRLCLEPIELIYKGEVISI